MVDSKEISLFPLTSKNADEVYSLWSDEPAVLFTNFPYIPDLAGCRERLAKMLAYYSQNSEHFGPYVIRAKDGAFLGLTGGDASTEEPGSYEIWYFIQRQRWGQKVATQAVRELLSRMSNSSRVRSIKAEVVVDNEPSWKFLERLGFERIERIPDGHKKDGRLFDRYIYQKKDE